MAEKKEYSQLEEFDPNWADGVNWSDPAAAQKQLKDKANAWAKAANDRLKNLNAGMTKSQERAAELAAQAKRAEEWDRWGNENRAYVAAYKDLAPAIERAGGVETALQRLRDQHQTTEIRREVQEGVDLVRNAYQTGELTWDQAQPMLQKLAAQEREIEGVVNWYKQGREKDYEMFRTELANMHNSTLKTMEAVLNPIIDGHDQFAPENRKLRPILEVMANKGYARYGDAYNAVHGAEEMREQIKAEYEQSYAEKIAAKEEELRRQSEQRGPGSSVEGGGGGDIGMGIWHRPAPKEETRPDFYQSVLGKLGKR